MNKSKVKSYAPQARRDFITAVSARAATLSLPPNEKTRVEVSGDVAIINGQAYPKNVAALRQRLLDRIKVEGWNHFVEEIAYTWFNRFTALRFMEVNGFLPHGLRVLSNPDGSKDEPEILEKAHMLDLPALDRERVIELKLATNKEAELYRLLLVAQCNQLHASMPFLFERINDETELLLPDNLLHTDSVIRKLVEEIDEGDWRQVEIIGWLYQFYISERKDEVIGKVVKSEDIPAATQLFTPNWIVKYMTQNSLGRMWLQTYPNSGLREKMEYYIEPADQGEEVKNELEKLTPESLNPEEIKILDPACGSGHILVEAYDLLKEIYRERGYRNRDIPQLILDRNLYGIDIDERAVQLACFAVLMKARADDRNLLEKKVPHLNILAIPDSSSLNAKELAAALLTRQEPKRMVSIRGEDMLIADAQTQPSLAVSVGVPEAGVESEAVTKDEVVSFLKLFEHGKTLGSLIAIPERMLSTVTALDEVVTSKIDSAELMESSSAEKVEPFVRAAILLSRTYNCVIANPPYMGNKFMNSRLKNFASTNYPDHKSDLFAVFIMRTFGLVMQNGFLGLMSPFVWMFLKSYEPMRQFIIQNKSIRSLVQPEYHSFFESAYVPICSFVIANHKYEKIGNYFDLSTFYGVDQQPLRFKEALSNPACGWRYQVSSEDFKSIPGHLIAYWVSEKLKQVFRVGKLLSVIAEPKQGLATADNNRFLRSWTEVSQDKIGLGFNSTAEGENSSLKWFPYNKGGDSRKWYGNQEWLVNWENDGAEIRRFGTENGGRARSRAQNVDTYFRESVSWSKITISNFTVRFYPQGFIYDVAGCSIFPRDPSWIKPLTGLFNSAVVTPLVSKLSPTLNYEVGQIANTPIIELSDLARPKVDEIVSECIRIAKDDWDSFETSWNFQVLPFIRGDLKGETIAKSFRRWEQHCIANIKRMQELERKNNDFFIEAYGLQDELSSEVPEAQITLARADSGADTRCLLSYAVGCMMGRYSLDEPGLIYAHSGGIGFDPTRHRSFKADDDGIIPVTDLEWFDDDAANRFSEFVRVAWSDDTHKQNLTWVAKQLGQKSTETPLETIRRYFSAGFYKDHMQTYKKRPIYWLFSSGKQKAFECLVYLHRYNESTLSRMRNEYVTPLFGKLSARIEYIGGENGEGGQIGSAGSTADKNKLRKQLEALKKKQTELIAFDEQLRHYADLRIKLDLDDGVRVNYGKFGTLLAEVRAVTGATSE